MDSGPIISASGVVKTYRSREVVVEVDAGAAAG